MQLERYRRDTATAALNIARNPHATSLRSMPFKQACLLLFSPPWNRRRPISLSHLLLKN